MVDKKRECNGCGDVIAGKSGILAPKATSVKVNGVALGIETGSLGVRDGDGLVTYKRRRNANFFEAGNVWNNSESHIVQKSRKQFFDRSNCIQKRFQDLTAPSINFTLKHHRDIVLEQICQSLGDEGSLKEIIQNATMPCTGSGRSSTIKESAHCGEDGNKFTLNLRTLCDGLKNEAKGGMHLPSCGSVNELNHSPVTELCQSTIFDIMVSEKFAQLCSLLLENFQGLRADNLLGLHHINSSMKNKAYENSPMLFHSDIQQVWMKLQKFGTDIIALAKSLSEITSTSFLQQAGSSACSISEDGRCEVLAQESDMHTKLERTEVRVLDEVHTCRQCGEKAYGRSGLVCDSCEEMYHISCVEPAVKEIPIRSWYCANCTAMGIESPHDNCIACERLNAFGSPFDGTEEDELLYEENLEELEENSNELVGNKGCKRFAFCKTCRAEIKRDEEHRICGHSFCLHKFYHVKCLTSKQLTSYGPCWYCPSCLCGSCFTDRDDDKIVLCDGCDHAYHTYCMRPPRSTIPKGKWFCQKCNTGIQRIRKAKRLHKNTQNISTKRSLNGKLGEEEPSQKSGGVDMLLNAAKTLNYEENLAAFGLKTK